MAFLIEDNNFTKDSYGVRATRLYYLSNTIDTYAAAVELTGSLLTWAQDASENFDAAVLKQGLEIGDKEEAFQTSQEAVSALAERYQILKDIIISRYPIDDNKLNVYGVDVPTPRTNPEIIRAAELLIGANAKYKAAGDTNVLPDGMIASFESLWTDAKEKSLQSALEREEAQKATEEVQNLFAEDSKKLRALYNWIISYWGKADTRLIPLGFVQQYPQSGSTNLPAVPMNLVYDEEEKTISWDAVPGATSYQVVHKTTGSADDFLEIYAGSDTTLLHADPPGNYTVMVRARNANGYGHFSPELLYTVDPTGPSD